MEKLLYNTLLYDFYADLITKRQRSIYQMYYLENLTLAEIGENFGITRQGVNSSLKYARKSLESLEETLGLIKKHKDAKEHVVALNEALKLKDFAECSRILIDLDKLL